MVCLFLGSGLFAQEPAIMRVPDIRPGMKGYGKTVFQGGKIERFEFEVLGVLNNAMGVGRNVVLVKASGGPLAQTGIIAGMSGSPCYIDGKLVGALALGWAYEKEPIGGITPIGEMLEQLKEIPEASSSRTPLIVPRLDPLTILKSASLGQMIPLGKILKESLSVAGEGRALPLPISGIDLSPESKALWEGLPVQFLGATALSMQARGEASPLEPGGMAAFSLVQGDLNMTSGGTITYASGKKLLMLGHEMYNLGAVDLPLWSATVAGILPSYNSSTKLVSPVSPVGALRLDRSTGVAAVLGAEARMVPLRLGVSINGKKSLNFRFDLMDNPFLTPVLAATVINQTLVTHVRGQGFQSLYMQGNIKISGHNPIQVECMVSDLTSARLAQYVGGLVQAVTLNPFERPVIEGISLNVRAEERLDRTMIAGVRILKARVKRGSVLPVLVTLQNIQGVRETATFNVNVPASARPGKATLLVGDGLSLVNADPDERSVDISSFGDMVRLLNGGLRNNHAYALLVQNQPGIGLRGTRIEGVPPTINALMGSDGDNSSNRLQRQIIGRSVLPLEREVNGLVNLDLEIE
jgi:hypothetical protein